MLKRRLDGKTLGMLFVAIVTICVSALAALRTEAWTINPADYRYDMSLYFSLASEEYENLDTYEIAAFVGDECRGLAEKLELPNGGSCLYMRIRSNNPTGEEVDFKMRDKRTGEIVVLKGKNGEPFLFKPDQVVGMPSDPYMMERYYNVVIDAGENGSVDFENGLYAAGTVLTVTAVPDEGYHFDGWSDGDREAVRTITVESGVQITATFAVNMYNAVFKIDGEVMASLEVAYGAPVAAPEVPSKEGYSFSGWDNVPDVMPAGDIEVNGYYNINSYKATFIIDGEVVAEIDFDYNAPVVAPEAPAKEGHLFTGWQNVPETMPPFDVEILGAYDVQAYTATFVIDDEVLATVPFDYGTPVVAPEAPVKEGHVFAGWENLPETMPAQDLEITGTYNVLTYKATFIIDGEVIATLDLEYNAPVVAPEAPAKEGHLFTGWQNVPETMPPFDVEILGTYDVQAYTITYVIDGEVLASDTYDYGTPINAPAAPVKEGHTFAGWENLPELMPAQDIEISGSYTVNVYKATFTIDGEVIATLDVEYNQPVNAPEAPAKEGHLFTGWQNVPETMPPFDIEILGTYDVQAYTATFVIDGEVIATVPFDFGAAVTAPEAPVKEGHTFAGWENLPETMPAQDIEISGAYTVNVYKATFTIDGEVVATLDVEYNQPVNAPEAPAKEGHIFTGWQNVPETMPPFDIEIVGTYDVQAYTATFVIDGEVIATVPFDFGAAVVAPEAPVKEGHTFAGWENLPETMPAQDIEISGAYTVNVYKATFSIDGEVVATLDVEYNQPVNAPEAPAKEGHIFTGWQNVPETMPPFDIEIVGTYDVQAYTATFVIDGEVIATVPFDFGAAVVAPEAPVKEGHTFAGWTNLPETMPAQDIEISGSYAVNSYKATFTIDGEVIATVEVEYNKPVETPEAPAKEGYTFSGWQNVPETMPPFDVEIVGAYAVNSYTATFKIDDEVVALLSVEYGAPINTPEAPAKEGYLFDGWQNVPETMPAQDIEILGSYSEDPNATPVINTYTATFIVDGEVIAMIPVEEGSALVAPEVPAKEGHTFAGWENLPEIMPSNDIEIHGSYKVNVYKAVFKIDGEVVATLDVEYNQPVNAPEAPAKEGHVFTGWQNVPETMPPFDIEILGTYDVVAYTATFVIDGEVIATIPFDFGAAVTAPEAPVKEGHTFSGWSNVPETMPAQDIEISGRYTVNVYKAVFKIDGEVIATVEVEYNKPVSAPEAPAKEGHVFTGWQNVPETMPPFDIEILGTYDVVAYTATFVIDGEVVATIPFDFGAAVVAPEAPVKEGHTFSGWSNVPETMPAQDIEISGSYTVNVYKAVFKIDGEVVATLDVEYNQPVNAPEAPAKEGHVFTGWQNVPETMPPFDIEILGTYDVQAYTATFLIDGEVIATIPFDFGAAVTAPEAPVKEGHTFAGWQNVPETMPAQDIEISGSYTVNVYKAVFKIDGEVIATVEVEYNKPIAVPEAPAKEGHIFTGWQNVPETMPPFDIEILGTYDVVAYTATFVIDGEVIATIPFDFGAVVIPPVPNAKEGHTFTGWQNLPETMPAQDIEIVGTYMANTYVATFVIDGEVIATVEVEYNQPVNAPEAPEKEGHVFTGWQNLPETMPPFNIEILGTYDVVAYTATFVIDGEVIATIPFDFGAAVVAPEAPVKEGHTFAGWQNVPETMPAQDIEISGSYTVNVYKATFTIDGEVIGTYDVEYNQPVVAPEAPAKEGHTFTGWQNLPETMPPFDIEISGTYSINTYTATFMIGDVVVGTVMVDYGAAITAPEAPEKEGQTFSGWQNLPETMPAEDIVVTGAYTVNKYLLSIYLNDELYSQEEIEFGAPVAVPDPEVGEGKVFEGWISEIPATMPAHDVDIYGVVSDIQTGLAGIVADGEDVTICNINGVVLYKDVKASEIKERLVPGLYIVNGKKVLVK